MKKLLTLNIEGDKHLERIRPFIAEENPDIVCLQEAFRDDAQELLGSEFQIEFLPMCLKERKNGALAQWGVAVATRTPAQQVIREYYQQQTTTLVPYDGITIHTKRKTTWLGVVGVVIADGDKKLTVFTTHFTWTPDGASNEYQASDMKGLLSFLETQEPHVLCGDFNIPRKQNDIYPILAAHYTDHVPQEYETSMYLPLHRTKDDPVEGPRVASYMVDYILSTPDTYTIPPVVMQGNVSDHCALMTTIEKI
jgi:endonuclease/exonuclease/phosphatase family metal-dependent hydrolase